MSTAIVMAVDLASMVDPVYPHSVDFLLKEALKDVHGDQVDSQKSIFEWTEQTSIMKEEEKQLLSIIAKDEEGRKPLAQAMANNLTGFPDLDIFSEIGVNKKSKIALADLAVWIFHDLQAAKLSKVK